MKIVITIALSLFTLANVSAQTSITDSQLIPYRQGSKWGYCDINKKIIIPCKYDYVTPFSEGLAGVLMGDRGFYIDPTGKTIIDNVGDPQPFNKKGSAIVIKGDFVRINRQGKIIEEKYCEWTPKLIDPKFHCGLAKVVKKANNGEEKYGFINEAGDLTIPFSYEYAADFSEDLTTVRNSDGKWAWIDKSGKQLTPFENLGYGHFNDGLAITYTINESKSRSTGYIDRDFRKVILPNKSFSLRRYGDGLFWAEQNGKFGFVDRAGNVKIPFIYTPQNTGEDIYYGSPFINGVAIVSKDNKLGLINKQGNVVLPIIYDILEYNKDLNLYNVAKYNQQNPSKAVNGYVSAQGVKYWTDEAPTDYKQLAVKNLEPYKSIPGPANRGKTCSYARMYLSNPKIFKWAGLAALVSGRVGEESVGFLSAASRIVRFDMVKVILKGNEEVYMDLYWQHLLVRKEGLAGVERAYAEGMINEQSYKGWVKILSAKTENDIWDGNKDLLYYEQSEILQRTMYDEYQKTWGMITEYALPRWLYLKSPIPPSNEPLFTKDDFADSKPNIANFEDRWDLIQRKILPQWRTFESNPANRPILMQSLKKVCPVLN